MSKYNFKNIGVVGSGAMGTGIATVALIAGCNVSLYDNNISNLDLAKKKIVENLSKAVEKQKISETQKSEYLNNLILLHSIDGFSKSDLIIEAIVEILEVKQTLFSNLESIVAEHCVLASNTSSLSIAAISGACKHKSRVVGIHFFNPANIMPLVEVIPSVVTDKNLVEDLLELINRWQKFPVVAKDTPGFIVNRIARPYYGEALRIYDEQIANFETIDYAMKNLGGFKMGPFELMDFIGHDVNYRVTETVFEQMFFDSRYKPSITQKRLFEAGLFGVKTKQGYYKYENTDTLQVNMDEQLHTEIFYRILVMLINEASDALYFGIAKKEDIETAMQKGVNYPKGLLHWADEIGVKSVYNQLLALYEKYCEDRYRPSILLKVMANNNQKFFNS